MTVYVDDWRQRATVGRTTAAWSHLMAGPDDDIAELHELAAKIGLKRSWFQDKPWPRAHYDVTETRRQKAIAAGAVPISWRDAGKMRTDAIARRRAPHPAAERHTCPAPGCERQVDDEDKFLCGTDWRRLPARLQTRIHAAWRHGAGKGTIQLRRAHQAALDELKRQDEEALAS